MSSIVEANERYTTRFWVSCTAEKLRPNIRHNLKRWLWDALLPARPKRVRILFSCHRLIWRWTTQTKSVQQVSDLPRRLTLLWRLLSITFRVGDSKMSLTHNMHHQRSFTVLDSPSISLLISLFYSISICYRQSTYLTAKTTTSISSCDENYSGRHLDGPSC